MITNRCSGVKLFIASKSSTMLQKHALMGFFIFANVFLQKGALLKLEVENFSPETTTIYGSPLKFEIIGQQYCIVRFPLRKALEFVMSHALTQIHVRNISIKTKLKSYTPSYITSPSKLASNLNVKICLFILADP